MHSSLFLSHHISLQVGRGVHDKSTIVIKIREKDAAIVVDGQHSETVHKNDEIRFYKDLEQSLFVLGEQSFFEKVQMKLR